MAVALRVLTGPPAVAGTPVLVGEPTQRSRANGPHSAKLQRHFEHLGAASWQA